MKQEYPFARAVPMDCRGRLIDSSETGASILLTLDSDEEVFRGHYPHFAIFPGVYLIETALQTVEYFVKQKGFTSVRMSVLKSARLVVPVRPGDELTCEAKLLDGIFLPQSSSWEVWCRLGQTTAAKIRMTVEAR